MGAANVGHSTAPPAKSEFGDAALVGNADNGTHVNLLS